MIHSLHTNVANNCESDFFRSHDDDYAGCMFLDDEPPSIYDLPEINLLMKPDMEEDILAEAEKPEEANNE